MTAYPVPRQIRPTPQPAKVVAVVFLPAAPAADTELPPLVMAPLMPAGWPKS